MGSSTGNIFGVSGPYPAAANGAYQFIEGINGFKLKAPTIQSFTGLKKLQGNVQHLNTPVANQGGGEGGSYTGKALAASAVLVADDVTGIGAIDDIAIPVIIAGAAVRDLTQIKYITYTLKNASGKTYVGRSSGYGDDGNTGVNIGYAIPGLFFLDGEVYTK